MRKRRLILAAFGLVLLTAACCTAVIDSEGLFGIAGGRSAGSEGSSGLIGTLFASAVDDEADDGDERVHLRVPDAAPLLVPPAPYLAEEVPQGALRAHAYHYISRVFTRPSKRPRAMGYVRRGMVLHARERVRGPGCRRGAWYALLDGGVVCSSDGFFVARDPRAPIVQRMPEVARALPYRYAKAKSHEALRFYRIPSEREESEIAHALDNDLRLPDVVERQLRGVYLLALDREEREGDRVFHRTVRGRYVRAQDLEPKTEPRMRGVLLTERDTLPYAFVYGRYEAPAPVHRVAADASAVRVVGVADNHARIRVAREVAVAGEKYVVGPSGLALSRAHVRVARRIERPDDVPAGAKWIHVNLKEQALVAYDGDRPVFATLVSSGKGKEYATPTGLYRVREKHVSTTMRGPDPDEGVYEVEEVPWTMFYHNSYALHGAYWHDTFGMTRSHGCTNIAPVDARWLFYWSDGDLPRGWNALRNLEGTYVYLTGAADVEPAG